MSYVWVLMTSLPTPTADPWAQLGLSAGAPTERDGSSAPQRAGRPALTFLAWREAASMGEPVRTRRQSTGGLSSTPRSRSPRGDRRQDDGARGEGRGVSRGL